MTDVYVMPIANGMGVHRTTGVIPSHPQADPAHDDKKRDGVDDYKEYQVIALTAEPQDTSDHGKKVAVQIEEDARLAARLQRIENALMPIYRNQIPPEGAMRRRREPKQSTISLPPYRSLIMSGQSVEDSVVNTSGVSPTPGAPKHGKIMSMLKNTNTTIKQCLLDASDTLSMKSMSLSTKSGPRKAALTFEKLPLEIKGLIVSQVKDSQQTLVNCLYVNKAMYAATLKVLYARPLFHTSYRLGQFVTTVTTSSKGLGDLVQVLDLSKIDYRMELTADEKVRFQDQLIFGTLEMGGFEGRPVLAGWRDWKYREHPLYSMAMEVRRNSFTSGESLGGVTLVNRTRSHSLGDWSMSEDRKLLHYLKRMLKVKGPHGKHGSSRLEERAHTIGGGNPSRAHREGCKTTNMQPSYGKTPRRHPLQNHFLREYTFSRDIPIGYVLHILERCPQLLEVNLNNVRFTKDFAVVGSVPAEYWTDSSRELCDFSEGELRVVPVETVWDALLEQSNVEVLSLEGLPSLDTNTLRKFVFESKFRRALRELHCRGAGMVRRPEWDDLVAARDWRRGLRWG